MSKHDHEEVHAIAVEFQIGKFLIRGTILDLPVTDKVTVHGVPVDKFGNTVKDAQGQPVKLDGPETCAATNPLNLAVSPQADGTSFVLTPTGTIDPAEAITITGSFKGAPLTSGPVPVPIISGAPVAILAVFDTPIPQ